MKTLHKSVKKHVQSTSELLMYAQDVHLHPVNVHQNNPVSYMEQ